MINILIVLIVAIGLWSIWGFFGSRVEQADYIVVNKMNGYEIREYPAHIVAQTTVQGSYGESMSNGFRIVAGYIFGDNTKKESIAMTAPVFAQKEGVKKVSENIAMTAPVVAMTEGDSQTISFGMPSSYTLETLPTPNDSRVKIVMIPTKKYAVMQFSWYRSDARVKKMQEKLALALTRDGVETQGGTAYAGYNAPWTPPWMNRNEVMFEIIMMSKDKIEPKVIDNNKITEDKIIIEKSNTIMKTGSYEAYSPEKIAMASADHDIVLFFKANWCPSCRTVDTDIKANLSKIPEDLTILDVDYDNSKDLKKKYGVTYQHTFVQVDKGGNLIKKWSGSPTLKALVSEIK